MQDLQAMGKSKMKNRGKNGRETNSSRSAEYITVNIDYDKLSNAIVSAHNRIESKKRLAEEESAKAWRKISAGQTIRTSVISSSESFLKL